MRIESLSELHVGAPLLADVIVIGSGPAGLTVAEELAGAGIDVLVLESGFETETTTHAALNRVQNVGELCSDQQIAKRAIFHGRNAPLWSQDEQRFGVRCRAFGGSTHAWAGKSAPFDPVDFARRDWVPLSGWPLRHDQLTPFVDRAKTILNLCPVEPPSDSCEADLLSFFWQFARSRGDGMDVLRVGKDVLSRRPTGLRVLLDATVTEIALNPSNTCFSHVEARSSVDTTRSIRVDARFCVLAASGIENARLLLSSRRSHASGIGNGHDQVGRYLMDHPSAQVGTVSPQHMGQLAKRFGFYGMPHGGRSHMFMHGLAIAPSLQKRDQLLNAAVYFTPMRSPDDPWDALRRMWKGKSDQIGRDLISVVTGTGMLARGITIKMLAHHKTPASLRDLFVNAAIRLSPNSVAAEFQTQGIPHRLAGLAIDAISEQAPNRDSRVTLSDQKDRFEIPIAKVDWRINEIERRTLKSIAVMTAKRLALDHGIDPNLEPWVRDNADEQAVIIDLGHTLGTTRMSNDVETGVVNADCKVHGSSGLYIAGGSVFPTSGHANPTLMIVALAVRLADHLKSLIGTK